VFLDVETTGLEEEDRLCEVAYSIDGEMHQEYFKPPLPIKVGAMAVSHITNKMVEDKEPFDGSDMQFQLNRLAQAGYVLVAHNAPFDMAMLAKEGIKFEKFIDTKKLSHALDQHDEMESHRMQYLRYYYGIEMENAVAHSADGDVEVLVEVYKHLSEKLGKTIEEEMEISEKPVLFHKITFGKYAGNLLGEVALTNPQYLEWLLKQKKESGQNEEDWIYTLEHYLKNV
jgi:exodeoxyribonuclease X